MSYLPELYNLVTAVLGILMFILGCQIGSVRAYRLIKPTVCERHFIFPQCMCISQSNNMIYFPKIQCFFMLQLQYSIRHSCTLVVFMTNFNDAFIMYICT